MSSDRTTMQEKSCLQCRLWERKCEPGTDRVLACAAARPAATAPRCRRSHAEHREAKATHITHGEKTPPGAAAKRGPGKRAYTQHRGAHAQPRGRHIMQSDTTPLHPRQIAERQSSSSSKQESFRFRFVHRPQHNQGTAHGIGR
eukprot:2591149-Prymnesium_polylepis.1